jgi:hypothetical protein
LSMHLVGPELTTTRTKKYKLNLTKAKRQQLEMDMFHYNKDRKRQGESKVTFDEYLDIRCGRVTKRKVHPSEQGTLDPNYLSLPPHRQNAIRYPSRDDGIGVATKKEPQQYTGDNMLGIGQLHKSNSVPVFRKEDAEDQAKMRRG